MKKSRKIVAPQKPLPPVRACIFDVDDLLLDSEDIYTDNFNEVLRQKGCQHLIQWAGSPDSPGIFSQQVVEQKDHFQACKALPGVVDLLENLKVAHSGSVNSHPMTLTITTADSRAFYRTKVSYRSDLSKHLNSQVNTLRDSEEMIKMPGKPDPYIYTCTLKRINTSCSKDEKKPDGKRREGEDIKPEECLVFEDSIAGVAAGRAAEVLAGKTEEVEKLLLKLEEERREKKSKNSKNESGTHEWTRRFNGAKITATATLK
ncbi:MAG: hypothetical protein Q9173_000232 [Seirophora scorigena]